MIPECPRAGDMRSKAHFQTNPSPVPVARGPSHAHPVSGLLSEIQTSIRKEPFSVHYTVTPGRELGRGKFSVVRKCIENSTGREYAAKFLRKRRKGQDCRMEIIHEIAVLELATASPRMVKLHQVYEMASEMVLILEFAAGGEIFNQCVSDCDDEALSEEDVKRLMRQILEGVSFFHHNNVVHLDLKPQNILLTSSCPLGDVKIVDFGLSRRVSSHHELREIMGTPEYVAPEILNYEPISTATDMWSIGVLAYVMLTGISPFLGNNKQETFLNISQLNVSYGAEELQQLDQDALSFIQMLLRRQPQERATVEQCLTHPWLQRTGPQRPMMEEEMLPVQDPETPSITSSSTRSAPPASSSSIAEEEESEEGEAAMTEELIILAAYTLDQGHQSSSSTSKEVMLAADQKAISQRFRFEILQRPGERLHLLTPTSTHI
ncbi:serine/threonine-protein kinase 17A [Xiphophorus couchianus]|uniref:serine/threonine-protein kinase 17A n=1 Tax=Xiphophorus couchianus TaxID=32473 RepID=UPI0010169767|nr:serine/threonine-protein kinase 17A-like [Xiphophorus couchianus]